MHEQALVSCDAMHRERRILLKQEIGRMVLFFTDQPSLLAPNIQVWPQVFFFFLELRRRDVCHFIKIEKSTKMRLKQPHPNTRAHLKMCHAHWTDTWPEPHLTYAFWASDLARSFWRLEALAMYQRVHSSPTPWRTANMRSRTLKDTSVVMLPNCPSYTSVQIPMNSIESSSPPTRELMRSAQRSCSSQTNPLKNWGPDLPSEDRRLKHVELSLRPDRTRGRKMDGVSPS